MRTLVMAVAVAACLPAASRAEPIGFGYSVTTTTRQVGEFDPGPLTPTFAPAAGWVTAGAGRGVIGSVHFGPSPGPLATHSSYRTEAEFTVRVAVSDPASGQTGTLLAAGRAVDEWSFSLDDWVFHGRELWWQPEHSLYLGGEGPARDAQYLTDAKIGGGYFRLYAERPDDWNTVVISLEAESVVAPNPEPGTLSLSALGVASVLALRLRRKGGKAG